ncbi:DUF3558 domain-containing protein [Streptomyces sp. NPDC052236]|uniref:DUF3558 domain-containing protein n=1 Tax=Streptomyces sp. NPDC052236 TaxID=3365686 RepID=UPI0037D510A0
MQRKAYVPGLAALLVALLAGCTADTGADGSATDSKAGQTQPSSAPAGKYRTLREPCGTVGSSVLKDLLPGAAELTEEQQGKLFRGTPSVTYDTDRRVGCSWKADAPDASHRLTLDYERVVSYDTTVSDDDLAQEVFAKKQSAASVPITPDDADDPASASATPSGSQTTSPAAPSAPTDTGTDPSDGFEPRELDGLGDAAFLDDTLTAAGSGSTAQNRAVSVVFRTSNVIVTLVYTEQSALATEVPDSKELQDKAQSLARRLAEQFTD